MENVPQDIFSRFLGDPPQSEPPALLPESEDSISPSQREECSFSLGEYERVEPIRVRPIAPTIPMVANMCMPGDILPMSTAMPVPVPPPASSAEPMNATSTFSGEEDRKSRRKRAKYRKRKRSAEDSAEREAHRLERNRKSAKESRVRKKNYIAHLEEELRRLRDELESYKVRLVKYEVIERQRDSSSLMTYKLIKDEVRPPGHDALEEARRIEANMKDFMFKYGIESQERRQAIEQLARTTVEIILPYTHKYLIWAAVNNSGLFNAENMEMPGFNGGEKDEWNSVVVESHASEEELLSVYETKPFFVNAAGTLRKLVNQHIACQRQIQEQMKLIDEYIYQTLIPKITPPSLNLFIKWLEKMKDKQELTEPVLYGYRNEDFGGGANAALYQLYGLEHRPDSESSAADMSMLKRPKIFCRLAQEHGKDHDETRSKVIKWRRIHSGQALEAKIRYKLAG